MQPGGHEGRFRAESKPRSALFVVLMSLSALLAIVMALAIPSAGTVTVTDAAGTVIGRDPTEYSPWLFAWQAALLLTATSGAAAIIAYLKGRIGATRQLLRVTAFAGLIVALVPGLLAFVAFQVIRGSRT